VSRAKELINYRWFQKKEWQEEIKRMLATGLKVRASSARQQGLPLPEQDLIFRRSSRSETGSIDFPVSRVLDLVRR